ncbi:MAG TPA: adenylate/guanylate cyclase domain-containing protein [Alphaproteobacteria bacterium]|nr:adenylate/guanylate cyclase domain-containing protein [Alphaproteobacteria bacterium]
MKNALDSRRVDRSGELLRWLNEEGRFASDTGRLLESLCEKLITLGVPLSRATAHVRTLHPEFRGVARIWRRGENIEIRTTRHGLQYTSDYQNSPIQSIIETGQWLNTRLDEATDRRFPILATLRGQGVTHYVMAPLVFSNRIVNAMSWATDAPGGFADADVELLEGLVTAFIPILEATASPRIYGELLATYVGRDPGARIMAGAVQRGDVHHLKAAMLLADLRGFSRLTDELPEERIVELLNAFFDLVVPGVIAGGGDILKFVGDAVIAIFPIPDGDPRPACTAALASARSALGALQAAAPEIREKILIDIALHCGDAAYGNIGSGNRLDFTAVGRDVNILSRLELLCKGVGRPILMTDTFAAAISEPVIEIGHFELRGFRRHQAVYAVCEEGEEPSNPERTAVV